MLTDTKGGIDPSTATAGNATTALTARRRPSRRRISEAAGPERHDGGLRLNRHVHGTTSKTQNSSTRGTFSRTGHILGHKTNAKDNYMPTDSTTSSSKAQR